MFGGDLSKYVPAVIHEEISRKLKLEFDDKKAARFRADEKVEQD